MLYLQRAGVRGDSDARAAEPDIAWLKAHNSEMAAWIEDLFKKETAVSKVGRAVGAALRRK